MILADTSAWVEYDRATGSAADQRLAALIADDDGPLVVTEPVEDVARTHDTLTITRNGTPAAVVLSIDDYASIMETLALLNDPVDQQRLAEAEESLDAGEATSAEDMGQPHRRADATR